MTIRVTSHGAAGEVTGSCHLIETDRARIIVDLGMFQGGASTAARNYRPLPFDPAALDAVLLTHAHLDHTGRLPMLTRRRFHGPVYGTEATFDLTGLILRDAGRLQQQDAERMSRHRARHGRPPVAPIYGEMDIDPVLRRAIPVEYGNPVDVAPGITATWVDAGHILGSASIRLEITDAGRTRTVVVSGDIGPRGVPILRDPETFDRADLILLESTYGDRDHRSREATREELRSTIVAAADAREKVLMPSFAVGRTQLLTYHLSEMMAKSEIPPVPVHIDSPMAIRATEIHRRHRDLFDAAARQRIEGGDLPLDFPSLNLVRDAADSRALNDSWDASIIIAGSGMCTGGRIVHHLRHNIWRRNVGVIFVGYQAEGTLGRRLVNRPRTIRIGNRTLDVRAEIRTIGGLSAHAGRSELIDWARAVRHGDRRFILVHGEPEPAASLAEGLANVGIAATPAVAGEPVVLD